MPNTDNRLVSQCFLKTRKKKKEYVFKREKRAMAPREIEHEFRSVRVALPLAIVPYNTCVKLRYLQLKMATTLPTNPNLPRVERAMKGCTSALAVYWHCTGCGGEAAKQARRVSELEERAESTSRRWQGGLAGGAAGVNI